MMGFGWIIGIGLIVLIIWLIIRMVNQGNQPTDHIGEGESSLDILKKRYAKGEISKQEFEEMKKELL